MKRILTIAVVLALGTAAKAQETKQPVIVDDAPTIFNIQVNPYYDYADQGRAMYINNSQFYNKDNVLTNQSPVGNGDYVQPGNSNPVNREMYQGSPAPSGTIYSGDIPVRQYGTSTTVTESER